MKFKNPFESNYSDRMIKFIAILFFILIVIGLVKIIVNMIVPAPITPTNFDPLFIEYLGLPYVFWVLIGMGVMFGLAIHGFKLIHIETKK